MVHVKLIKEEANKTTCELLNVESGNMQGTGIDRIVVSDTWSPYPYSGFTVTREDFEYLFNMKKLERERANTEN